MNKVPAEEPESSDDASEEYDSDKFIEEEAVNLNEEEQNVIEEPVEEVETTTVVNESYSTVPIINSDENNQDFEEKNAEADRIVSENDQNKNENEIEATTSPATQESTVIQEQEPETTTTSTTTIATSTTSASTSTSSVANAGSSRSNVYFKPKSYIFHLNGTFNEETFIIKHCPSLTCEFGFRTDLNGKPLCDCFNPCYEKKCGSQVCVIIRKSEMDFEPECYDQNKLGINNL